MGDAWPILLLLLLAAGGEDVPNGKDGGIVIPPAQGGRAQLQCAFKATGLGPDWLRFFEQTSKRESGFNNLIANERGWEPGAARRAAQRNWTEKRNLSTLGWSLDAWSFGSGGWFGQLPANNLGIFTDAFIRERGPRAVFEMGASLAAAVGYARGIMGWKNFDGTWASLDVGWGNPSKMSDPEKLDGRPKRIEDRAAGLGYARGWALDSPTRPPARTREQWVELAIAAQRAAEGC